MDKEFKIDYLQFSTVKKPEWIIDSQDDYRKRSNKQFYTHMTKYKSGMLMYEGNINTDKRLIVMSGAVCAKYNIDAEWLMYLITKADATVSRMDLCVTVSDNILEKIQKDHKAIQSNLYNKIQIISDVEYTPQTVYIGDFANRKKKGIVRAYNKALQLGLTDISMYRLEIEMKQKHAQIATKRLAHGETIPSVMQSKFKIDRPWFNDIFGNDISTMRFSDTKEDELTEIERKMIWLEKQVLPSLMYVRDYDKANGTNNLDRILSRLLVDYGN